VETQLRAFEPREPLLPKRSFLLLIFFGQILVSAFPKWDWLRVGEGPPRPRSPEIIEFAGDCELNLAAESLTGKILI